MEPSGSPVIATGTNRTACIDKYGGAHDQSSLVPAIHPADPVGEVLPGGQGGGVLGTEDPLKHRQQRRELITGSSRVPRYPGPVGEVMPVD